MAINKELYERYKQLKAQGVNITLAQLKSEMENETQISTTPSQSQNLQNNPQTQNVLHQENNSYKPLEQNISSSNSGYQSNYMSQFSSNQNSQNIITPTQNTFHGNVSDNIKKDSKVRTKYALIGYPLGHSLSSYIHEAGFKSIGGEYTYELLETHPNSLVERVKYLKYNDYAGFNVTIPLKLPITMFLDEIDESADLVGAINTVIINEDKTLKGYNTDVIGFKNAIPQDINLEGKSAGVMGTGGAARAALSGLISMGVKNIKIFTRNIPNSVDLLNYLNKTYPDIIFNTFQIEHIRNLSDIDMLVNCTPIGMQGRGADYTPVEEKELCTLPEGAIVYDVIYNPRKTVLIKLAQKNGYRTINGLDMLIYQALESEKIWTGKTPDLKDMKISALENY